MQLLKWFTFNSIIKLLLDYYLHARLMLLNTIKIHYALSTSISKLLVLFYVRARALSISIVASQRTGRLVKYQALDGGIILPIQFGSDSFFAERLSGARYRDNAILKTGSYETPSTRRASDVAALRPILRAALRSKANELSWQFAYIIQNEIARYRGTVEKRRDFIFMVRCTVEILSRQVAIKEAACYPVFVTELNLILRKF